MESQFLLLWVKRALIFVVALILVLVIAFGVRAKSHADSLTQNLNSGVSAEELSKSANALSGDVNLALSIANLPIIKQVFSVANVNFVPIKDEIRAVIEAAPILAGADSPKRYMVAFQNSAEARGTGGILGAFAIVELNKGSLSVVKTGSNAALKWIDEIPIKMPSEFKVLYRDDPAIWQNSNLSPHFPYGAKIWLALWKKQFGQSLDGVIAVDPSALSYVLKATGPVTLPSGKVLTSENLVSETLSAAYKEYEKDNEARKQYLVSIINATFKKLLEGNFSKVKMASALQKGIVENRILIYSTDSSVETKLRKTRLAGAMEMTPSNQYRAVIQNIDASKLDYYLEREVSVQSLSCGVSAEVEVSVTVKNSLASGKDLPAYVLTRSDKSRPKTFVAGQHRFLLFIYGPPQTELLYANRSSIMGSAGGVATERQRPVLVTDIDLAPGGSERVSAVFTRGTGILKYHSQPLVSNENVKIVDDCK
jgi:uncharacterized protein Usg